MRDFVKEYEIHPEDIDPEEDIDVDIFDLDDDGEGEILISLPNNGLTGLDGSPFYILKKAKKTSLENNTEFFLLKWEEHLNANSKPTEDIYMRTAYILNNKTNGMHDILLINKSCEAIYQWKNKCYHKVLEEKMVP